MTGRCYGSDGSMVQLMGVTIHWAVCCCSFSAFSFLPVLCCLLRFLQPLQSQEFKSKNVGFFFIVAISFMYNCPCFRKTSRNIDFTTAKSRLLYIVIYVKFFWPFSLSYRYYQDDWEFLTLLVEWSNFRTLCGSWVLSGDIIPEGPVFSPFLLREVWKHVHC